MRIFLTILLILLLILVIILMSSVALAVEFWNGEFTWAVRYFGIKVYPFKEKEEKEPDPAKEEKKAQKKAEKEAKKQAEKQAAKEEKKKLLIAEKMRNAMQALAERGDMIGNILSAVPRPLQKLLRSVTLDKVETDFLIGGEDAADTALLYGKVQIAVQNLLANLGKHIRVKRKNVKIACDFTADESRWDFRCSVKVHIGTAAAAALWFLWKYWRAGKHAEKAIVDPVI